jgi:hypothetical protein
MIAKPTPDALLQAIAAKHLFLDTLDTRNSDSLDFHEVAVWAIRAAMTAAFAAGQAAGRRRMTMTTTPKTQTALDAFLAAKAEIDAMLVRLSALSADHFETHPDAINWGHVGTLTHYSAKLREITDMALREGEHAV